MITEEIFAKDFESIFDYMNIRYGRDGCNREHIKQYLYIFNNY